MAKRLEDPVPVIRERLSNQLRSSRDSSIHLLHWLIVRRASGTPGWSRTAGTPAASPRCRRSTSGGPSSGQAAPPSLRCSMRVNCHNGRDRSKPVIASCRAKSSTVAGVCGLRGIEAPKVQGEVEVRLDPAWVRQSSWWVHRALAEAWCQPGRSVESGLKCFEVRGPVEPGDGDDRCAKAGVLLQVPRERVGVPHEHIEPVVHRSLPEVAVSRGYPGSSVSFRAEGHRICWRAQKGVILRGGQVQPRLVAAMAMAGLLGSAAGL